MKVDFALSLLLIHTNFDDVIPLHGWNKFRGLRVDCSTLRCGVPHPLCTETFESLEWNEAETTTVVEESCHPTGDP